jgi:putative phosphoesterase
MTIGVISDIHGNEAALERALALMGPVDEVFCLGDVISQHAFSNEVVAQLCARGALVIRGNHEDAFFSPAGAAARRAPGIDAQLMAWLEAQPSRREEVRAGRRLLMVHSTTWDSSGYVSWHHPEFQRFAEAEADIVLCGHTHQPVVRRVGDILVINPGSTGQRHWNGSDAFFTFAVLDAASERAEIIKFTV